MELLTSLLSPRCHSRLKLYCGLGTKSPNLSFQSFQSGQCRHLLTSHRDSPSVSGVMDDVGAMTTWSHLNTASSELPYNYTRKNYSRLFNFLRCEIIRIK